MEIVCAAKPYPGFKSLSLRQFSIILSGSALHLLYLMCQMRLLHLMSLLRLMCAPHLLHSLCAPRSFS